MVTYIQHPYPLMLVKTHSASWAPSGSLGWGLLYLGKDLFRAPPTIGTR